MQTETSQMTEPQTSSTKYVLPPMRWRIEKAKQLALELWGTSEDELTSKRRFKHILYARYALMMLLHDTAGCTDDQISKLFNMQRSNVTHGRKTASNWLGRDPHFTATYESLQNAYEQEKEKYDNGNNNEN